MLRGTPWQLKEGEGALGQNDRKCLKNNNNKKGRKKKDPAHRKTHNTPGIKEQSSE